MTHTFINSPEDMDWLAAVHGICARSAMIYGNEDAPSKVEAYDKRNPKIGHKPRVYQMNADGRLQRV